MSTPKFDPAVKTVLDTILLPVPLVTAGSMFGYPAYFVNRKMFACVYESAVGLKVDPELAIELLHKAGFSPFVPMGRNQMKAWVQLNRDRPEDFLQDKDLLEQSIQYVLSLKQ